MLNRGLLFAEDEAQCLFLWGITKKYKAYNLLVLENDRKRHTHLHSCLDDVFIVDIDKFDGAFIYICSGLINVLQ